MAAVWLVGAGPGDAGLITVRGRDLLAACDCVVHDHLVAPAVLALAPASAERHDVGKRGHAESAKQEDINRLLVDCGRRHRLTVRLKGGDPFLFGRGGEECAALAANGITFGVVPGVTAGTGVPAYAGIPVTHRAASSAVVFVTGHQQRPSAGTTVEPIDWASFAKIETIVLYMGMHRLRENCQALIDAGRAPETPAAAIQWGTLPEQRTVTGTLADLPELAASAGLGAPAITVIGEVVRWRDQIRWFDDPAARPLWGRRIVVTRAQAHAGRLAELFAERGAAVITIPLARFEDALDPGPLDQALETLVPGTWIAFTSVTAVEFTCDRLWRIGRDLRAFASCRLAAVGPTTAAALAKRKMRPDLVADPATAAALAEGLIAAGGTTALLPRADNGREVLAQRLTDAGWTVSDPIAYRTVTEPIDPALFTGPAPDAVTLASAATADRLVAACGQSLLAAWAAAGCRFYAIGPHTAAAIRAHRLPLSGQADEATVGGLVDAVVADLGAALRTP